MFNQSSQYLATSPHVAFVFPTLNKKFGVCQVILLDRK